MKLIFAGTPAFAATALQAILDAGHGVALVLTQPDRPAGRGMKLAASPVKQLAQQHALPVYQPRSLRDAESQETIRQTGAELMVVVAYGLILPQTVLDMPRRGCINIHASLLPRWRGAAPIQRAILAGDGETGITIMQMDAGLDTGPVLVRRAIAIAGTDTAATLGERLAALGAEMVVDCLARLDQLAPVSQAAEGASYAAKIDKAEAALDWTKPAQELERQVRAYYPSPGATASYQAQTLKVWRAELAGGDESDAPGRIIAADRSGIVVACGSGALRIVELQRPGSRRLAAGEFLQGLVLAPGDRLA